MDSIDSQQFLTNVATNIVEDSAKNAWNKIKKFFKDLDAKDSIRYKTAYEKYLINTKQKVLIFEVWVKNKSQVSLLR